MWMGASVALAAGCVLALRRSAVWPLTFVVGLGAGAIVVSDLAMLAGPMVK